MQTANNVRDGIMFLGGLSLLIVAILLLTATTQEESTYSFNIRFLRAQSIANGAIVQVSGVPVGQVTNVALQPGTNRSLVTVKVQKSVKLRTDDIYSISDGGLMAEKTIDITPGDKGGALVTPGLVVVGASTPEMNDLVVSSSKLLTKLDSTVDGVNTVVNNKNTQQGVQQIVVNLAHTTAATAELTDSLADQLKANRGQITAIIHDLHNTTNASSQVASSVNHLMRTHESDLGGTLVGIRQSATASADLMAQIDQAVRRNSTAVDGIVADLGGVSHDIRQISDSLAPQLAKTQIVENLDSTTANVAGLTKKLDSIAASVDTLVSDPSVAAGLQAAGANLKVISDNLRLASNDLPRISKPLGDAAPEATANLVQITRSLNNTSKDVSNVARKLANFNIISNNVRKELEFRGMLGVTGSQTLRADANLDLRGTESMARVGMANIGNGNTLNLQLGNVLGPDVWLRYGVMQSHLGLGVDYRLSKNLLLTGETFNPRNPRGNLLVDYRLPGLGNACWLSAGLVDLPNNRNGFGVGLVFRPPVAESGQVGK